MSLLVGDLADPGNVDVKVQQDAESILRKSDDRVVVRYNSGPYIGALASRPSGYVISLANVTAYPKAPAPQGASRQ